jgi:hypothetical protein
LSNKERKRIRYKLCNLEHLHFRCMCMCFHSIRMFIPFSILLALLCTCNNRKCILLLYSNVINLYQFSLWWTSVQKPKTWNLPKELYSIRFLWKCHLVHKRIKTSIPYFITKKGQFIVQRILNDWCFIYIVCIYLRIECIFVVLLV